MLSRNPFLLVSLPSISIVLFLILAHSNELFVGVNAQSSSKAVMLFISRPLDTLNKNLIPVRDPERTNEIYRTFLPHVTSAFAGGVRSASTQRVKTRKWSLPGLNQLGSQAENALNFQVMGTAPGGLIDIESFDLSWEYLPLKLSNPIASPLSPTGTELNPYDPAYPGVLRKENDERNNKKQKDMFGVPNADLYGDEQVEKEKELEAKKEKLSKDLEDLKKLKEKKKEKKRTVTDFFVSYAFDGGDPIDYVANAEQNTQLLENAYGGSLTGMNPFTITKVVDTTSTIFGDGMTPSFSFSFFFQSYLLSCYLLVAVIPSLFDYFGSRLCLLGYYVF